jgi:hypothetical protein
MAKKKAKKTKAKKKVMRRKEKVVRKKKARKVKAKGKGLRPKAKGEKVLGVVDHFFGNISVAGVRVKSPVKVGDVVHIKGHTTDFVQKIESMQIQHERVLKAKKGDDIGIKVKSKVRDHDVVYLAAKEQGVTAQPSLPSFAAQRPMMASRTESAPPPPAPSAAPNPKTQAKKPGSYSNTKFFKF